MNKVVKKEVEKLIKKYKLNCSIKKFQDRVGWISISANLKLSEEFIREFKDKVDWLEISLHQKLSEEFIREFKDDVAWFGISLHQKLSEEFIREFKDKVFWGDLSEEQQYLKEKFKVEEIEKIKKAEILIEKQEKLLKENKFRNNNAFSYLEA